MKRLTFADLWRHPANFPALGFGSGLAPKAPGTFGSLAALPVYLLFAHLPIAHYLAVVAVSFVLGVWLCDASSRVLEVHDHPGIVWDEFVGMWIALIAVPPHWAWILAAFALFRFFDIIKPWPIGWLDKRVSGGFGIMLDDVLAGLFALALLQLAAHVL